MVSWGLGPTDETDGAWLVVGCSTVSTVLAAAWLVAGCGTVSTVLAAWMGAGGVLLDEARLGLLLDGRRGDMMERRWGCKDLAKFSTIKNEMRVLVTQ